MYQKQTNYTITNVLTFIYDHLIRNIKRSVMNLLDSKDYDNQNLHL